MSFTSVEIVRKHVLEKRLGVNRIDSESVKLLALVSSPLRFPPVITGSETVKAITGSKPDFQIINFAAGDQVDLNKKPIVRDTVVVAADSSLGVVYQENIDYLFDYSTGVTSRIPEGGIMPEANIIIWYLPYKVYIKDMDYRINYSKGEISRLNDSAIQSGQSVYVDYDSSFGGVDDDVITNAINEANEQVLNYIDPAYATSSDRSLVIAETYLTVSIICRIRAIEAADMASKDNIKSAWITIADQYKREAFSLLEKFAGLSGGFAIPQKA